MDQSRGSEPIWAERQKHPLQAAPRAPRFIHSHVQSPAFHSLLRILTGHKSSGTTTALGPGPKTETENDISLSITSHLYHPF